MHRARLMVALVFTFLSLVPSIAVLRAETFECLVEPYVEVEIGSGVPGILDQVPVDRGDRVRKDQVVAELRSDLERASYNLVKARVEYAARRVERSKELYRRQMISIEERDELETEHALLELELIEAEERLKLRTIRSPLDGVVVKRHFSPGEYIQQDPIMLLAQIDPLRVEVVVPVTLYGRIEVGMTAGVEWEIPTGGPHFATVTIVDPVVDAASGTIGIRLELPNPDYRLPAGTKCSVEFPIETKRAEGD